MEEMSLMEEEGGRLSLLFTAAPVLRESTAAGGYNVKRVLAGAQIQPEVCKRTEGWGTVTGILKTAEELHSCQDNINKSCGAQSQCRMRRGG